MRQSYVQAIQQLRLRQTDFKPFQGKSGVDWAAALDFIKERARFVEDVQLSYGLDIPQSTLSTLRCGRGDISDLAKLRILALFGVTKISDAISMLETDEAAARARRAERRLARKQKIQPSKAAV